MSGITNKTGAKSHIINQDFEVHGNSWYTRSASIDVWQGEQHNIIRRANNIVYINLAFAGATLGSTKDIITITDTRFIPKQTSNIYSGSTSYQGEFVPMFVVGTGGIVQSSGAEDPGAESTYHRFFVQGWYYIYYLS